MCAALRSSKLERMGTVVTITLELRAAGGSLAGRAIAESGAERHFAGWLGLVTALDALVPGLAPDEDEGGDHVVNSGTP
jgi:hypothetical protein